MKALKKQRLKREVTRYVGLRVDIPLFEAVTAAAAADRRSLSDFIRKTLADRVGVK